MSVHPLSGVIEKLRNADFHLRRLESEVRLYMNGQNAVIETERDPNSGKGYFRLKVRRQPPLKIAAIAGDIVHNLRSSLDYIVEELVKKAGHTPGFQHMFPLCSSPEAFSQALKKGRLYGVEPRPLWAIEQFQPYFVKPHALPHHPLLHLHSLSNRDKHHMLAVVAMNAGFTWKFVAKGQRVVRAEQTTEPVGDGGILAEVPLDFVFEGEKAQLQAKITIGVGFGDDPAFKGSDVPGALDRIREHIGAYILPAFATFFPPLPDDLQLTSHTLAPKGQSVEMLLLGRQEDPPREQ